MQRDTLDFFFDTNECAMFAIGLSEIDKTNTLGVLGIHSTHKQTHNESD